MIKKAVKSLFRNFGYDVVRYDRDERSRCLPSDFEKIHADIIEKVSPYTMTSSERVYALIESVRYILNNDVSGGFLECGVCKGGSMMAVALTLIAEGTTDKDLYLFDTFEGMPAPSEKDVERGGGKSALEFFSEMKISDVSSSWANSPLDDVKQAMALTGYPMDKIHFVKGLVEETIPENAPEKIALLRLDTDWYQSTKHEMVHLYPRLSPRGIVIVDDYGHWAGAKDAVDEYFRSKNIAPFLHRIDYTGRLIIKE